MNKITLRESPSGNVSIVIDNDNKTPVEIYVGRVDVSCLLARISVVLGRDYYFRRW